MKVHYIQRFAIVFMLLVALIGGSLAVSQPQAAEAATASGIAFTFDCPGARFSVSVTGTYETDDAVGPFGGDLIFIVITDTTGMIQVVPASFETAASTVASRTNMGWERLPVGNTLHVKVTEAASLGDDPAVNEVLLDWTGVPYTCFGGGGGAGAAGGAAPAEKKVGPGPDMIPIPAGGAVGTFVADTTLLFAPNAGAWTGLTMKAGQSLWVFGVDESGQFYQVVLAGQKLWVPVAAMAPTHDKYWDGKKLPDTTVK